METNCYEGTLYRLTRKNLWLLGKVIITVNVIHSFILRS
jgi:hypothetical protein